MEVATSTPIEDLVEPTLNELGFELVQVRLLGSGGKRTLQIMAEPVDPGVAMTVEHCAEISHAVSAVLDVADPIAGRYVLEVSSPGVDRPLVRPKDFERFKGFEAKLELDEPLEGQRRFRGRLGGLSDDDVLLDEPAGTRRLPLAAIRKARLLLTDELLKAAQANRG